MTASNATIKRKVAQALLCYICEQRPPLLQRDEFGGYSCQSCQDSIARMRQRYARMDGYSERAPQSDVIL